MSPVNQASSVSEISPRHSCVRMRSRAGPVTEISVYATEILVTGMKIPTYEHSSLGNPNGTF